MLVRTMGFISGSCPLGASRCIGRRLRNPACAPFSLRAALGFKSPLNSSNKKTAYAGCFLCWCGRWDLNP
ncbi:hypothetical protein LJC42_06015 [Eubacteriales bacterium OttesenSCG-928-K08]|nr:hypothetical protein [Eubacteriales bacterium OttesenSCG-928-K08]